MQIRNNPKLYIPHLENPEKPTPTKPSLKNVIKSGLISNVYYHPIFTGKEMSDEEFSKKLYRLKSNYSPLTQYLTEIFDSCTKENINLANTLLNDKNIDKLNLDIPNILKNVTEENSKFTEKLCRDKNFPKGIIPRVIQHVSKDTLNFAEILYEQKEYTIMENVLSAFQTDKIYGLSGYILEHAYTCSEAFPKKTVLQVKNIYNIKENTDIFEKIFNDAEIKNTNRITIFENITQKSLPFAEYLYNTKNFNKENIGINLIEFLNNSNLYGPESLQTLLNKVEYQRKHILKKPDKYINGMHNFSLSSQRENVKELFDSKFAGIMLAASVLDKESLDALFRKRFNYVNNYIKNLSSLKETEIRTFRKIVQSQNIDNKPFLPTQKIEFLDLIKAYQIHKIPMTEINIMINKGQIDLSKLQLNLLKHIFQNLNILTPQECDTIQPQKLLQWDISKIHLLSSEIEKDTNKNVFEHLLKASLCKDFTQFILNPNNIYGYKNKNTHKLFNTYHLNYNNWINPPASNNVHLKLNLDDTNKKTQLITESLEKEIESLRTQTPSLQKYLDKVLQKYIQNNQFKIPETYKNSPRELEKFTSNLLQTLNKVWTRAEDNIAEIKIRKDEQIYNNFEQAIISKAENTLLIRTHLQNILSEISQMDKPSKNSTIDITVKMWDRIPQKDLFQGNYSTCCVGMGKCNGQTMPYYLLHTAFNMIELKDNKTGEIIGNALCYWANNSKGVPALVIDNIEINNNFICYFKKGNEIRDAIIQYARNIVNSVSKNERSKIIMGKNYNDIPTKDLQLELEHICFIGDITESEIYLDLYEGWTRRDLNLYNHITDVYSFTK